MKRSVCFLIQRKKKPILAWLLEKFHHWTYHPEEKKDNQILPETISNEEFLTELTIYYMTNSISSSIRIYYEFLQQHEASSLMSASVAVPYALSSFAHELMKVNSNASESIGSQTFNHYCLFRYLKNGQRVMLLSGISKNSQL